jgi:tRNA (guanine-N7-)-methyltransferase
MGKDKLRRFAELHTFQHVIESDIEEVFNSDHPVKGNWNQTRFNNSNPIVLELGCGKGEYTVKLASVYSLKNFIGVDIKGNRMWVGAKQALEYNLLNVNFLRTRIEFISAFFKKNEIDEIWITFPDPQSIKSRRNKRLTSPSFLNKYKLFIKENGIVHLKTDSDFLYNYTLAVIEKNKLETILSTYDLYNSAYADLTYGVKTHYEQIFLGKGQPIHYLQFKLDGCDQIEEPDNFE